MAALAAAPTDSSSAISHPKPTKAASSDLSRTTIPSNSTRKKIPLPSRSAMPSWPKGKQPGNSLLSERLTVSSSNMPGRSRRLPKAVSQTKFKTYFMSHLTSTPPKPKSTAKAAQKPVPRELSGSAAVLEAFLEEGVDTIFGYPGGAIMPIYDALYDYRDRLNHILVRHEQGGIHAAQGYARTSGRTGVVFATSGPGATNLVTGLADAQIDSTPLVCITGQVFAHLLGTDAFQETDVINITTPVTKWNYQVTDATEIPEVIAKAFYIAKSGRPGPVLIDITKNAQIQKFDYKGYTPCKHIRSYRPKPIVRPKYLQEAAE